MPETGVLLSRTWLGRLQKAGTPICETLLNAHGQLIDEAPRTNMKAIFTALIFVVALTAGCASKPLTPLQQKAREQGQAFRDCVAAKHARESKTFAVMGSAEAMEADDRRFCIDELKKQGY